MNVSGAAQVVGVFCLTWAFCHLLDRRLGISQPRYNLIAALIVAGVNAFAQWNWK